jgi:hypothetical protein
MRFVILLVLFSLVVAQEANCYSRKKITEVWGATCNSVRNDVPRHYCVDGKNIKQCTTPEQYFEWDPLDWDEMDLMIRIPLMKCLHFTEFMDRINYNSLTSICTASDIENAIYSSLPYNSVGSFYIYNRIPLESQCSDYPATVPVLDARNYKLTIRIFSDDNCQNLSKTEQYNISRDMTDLFTGTSSGFPTLLVNNYDVSRANDLTEDPVIYRWDPDDPESSDSSSSTKNSDSSSSTKNSDSSSSTKNSDSSSSTKNSDSSSNGTSTLIVSYMLIIISLIFTMF